MSEDIKEFTRRDKLMLIVGFTCGLGFANIALQILLLTR
jgi:hypothetical protein